MDKVYSPAAIEPRIYQQWESSGWFAPRAGKDAFCIVIPPPNVTGTLHMGHAFQDTIMDALTRYHRMRGDQTLWQPGTDHAGIATQMVVERQLNAEGKRRTDLSRDQFVERVWQWKETSGGTITRQMRRLGASVDWSRDRFTMDEGLSRAVREAFVRLHQEGLIYRGKRLVNWDPVLRTALSDLEVLSEEEPGHLWHLRYPLEDGSDHLVVATTRPETLLGDAAVAVHPDDERYRHLIGKRVRLPIVGRLIPIIADTYVDPAFGTGCVKITPAHDFNDYAVGTRHQLPLINVFTPDAQLNDVAPEALRGLDRYEARKRMVAQLESEGLLEKVEPHKQKTPRGDRSGAVIEPYLTDQWYVRTDAMAAAAVAAVESGRTRFVPANWDRTFYQWMKNIQDWCISRQLWWGHRIPAWYDASGNIYVAHDVEQARAQARAQHGRDVELTQDEDVLDTWFSSALWPFSTMGWPDTTAELKRYYPTNVLVTGFDIIFFWVARMMMMGLKFMDEVPFRDVYVHGLVLDAEGRKMSKSKGNVIDPIDIVDGIGLDALVAKRTSGLMQPKDAPRIEKETRKQFPSGIEAHGTDALRFTFASQASHGREIRFDVARVAGYRNFCNKLWNAARFILMAIGAAEDESAAAGQLAQERAAHAVLPAPSAADRWIRSRLGATIRDIDTAVRDYRFDFAAAAIYQFAWYELCDWYLEMAKPALQNNDDPAARLATQRNLLVVFETMLRAVHPLMPFITEEIWQRLAPLARVLDDGIAEVPALMLAPWPDAAAFPHDEGAEAEIHWVQQMVLGIRQIRGMMDIAPSRKLPLLLDRASDQDRSRVQAHRVLLERLAGLASIDVLGPGQAPPPASMANVDELILLVPMQGLIDPPAELTRLQKRLEKLDQELARAAAKLGNAQFVNHAPPEVVATEQSRVLQFKRDRAAIERQMEQVKALL